MFFAKALAARKKKKEEPVPVVEEAPSVETDAQFRGEVVHENPSKAMRVARNLARMSRIQLKLDELEALGMGKSSRATRLAGEFTRRKYT